MFKVKIKTPERRYWQNKVINFEHISHLFQMFLLLALNKWILAATSFTLTMQIYNIKSKISRCEECTFSFNHQWKTIAMLESAIQISCRTIIWYEELCSNSNRVKAVDYYWWKHPMLFLRRSPGDAFENFILD